MGSFQEQNLDTRPERSSCEVSVKHCRLDIPVVKGKGEKLAKDMLSECEQVEPRRYLWKRSCTNRIFRRFDRYLNWLVGCLNSKQQIIHSWVEQASADAAFEQLNRRAMLSTFPYRSACWPSLWPGKWGRYQIARHGTRPDPRVSGTFLGSLSCVCFFWLNESTRFAFFLATSKW